MKNTTGYFIDKVSEDSFYENLLIGLPKVLGKLPNITEKKLKRTNPATTLQILNWENYYAVSLPKDFHEFYLSTNGLLYTYTFSYEASNREENEQNKLLGKLEINSIEGLTLIGGYELKNFARIYHDGYIYRLDLSQQSKLFELSSDDTYKIVLVYTDPRTTPTIWLNDLKTFYFIANDISTYLRMAIAHLGVPNWQFTFSPLGLPGRSREMLQILAPGVLYEDRGLVACNDEVNNVIVNKINPTIFNTEVHLDRKVSSAGNIGRKASVASSGSEKVKKRINKRSGSCKRPYTPKS